MDRRVQYIIRNLHPVKFRIGLPQSLEHGITLFRGRLPNSDRLKAPFQCAVLADGRPELFRRRCTNQANLSTCQLRFQHIGGINRPFRCAGAHNGVQFINK